jgi:CheY-like chemotaxis protein
LRKEGYSVVCVRDGQEAVEMLETDRFFSAILMDIQMPRMDGIEATRKIRQSERRLGTQGIPIIAFTAHAMKGDEEQFLAAGMNDYLSKPIDTPALHKKLSKWCARPG